MTPTRNNELSLLAQLGVRTSEPSVSEPAVSRYLVIELRIWTSEAMHDTGAHVFEVYRARQRYAKIVQILA